MREQVGNETGIAGAFTAELPQRDFCPEIYPGLSRVPLRNEDRAGDYSSILYADIDLVALYFETGDLYQVINIDTGKVVYPPKVASEWKGPRHDAQVYFIRAATGEIKIGMATNIKARMRNLQCSNPSKLELLAWTEGGPKQERAYHQRFAAHRLAGEWFSPAPEILAEIERLSSPAPSITGERR